LISTVEKILTGFKNWSRPLRKSRKVLKTGLDKSRLFLCYKVSICLNFFFVSIETLDLDISKSWSWPSRKSWQVLKTGLDAKDVLDLDLDWSRLSRPPTLLKTSLSLSQYSWLKSLNMPRVVVSVVETRVWDCRDLQAYYSSS
jgi:hypothetical protein